MKRLHLLLSLIAIVFLLGSFGEWPYGYYVILRFVVCGTAAYIAYLGFKNKIKWVLWVFGIIVVLFNPIWKMQLGRGIWLIVDVLAIGAFVIELVPIKRQR